MSNLLFKIVTLGLVLAFNLSGFASAGEINTGSRGIVAINGYDPVAYFTERRAVKGELTISHNWLGAIWRFSNEKHKTLFSQNPVKYAPQYGGHCADGIALGEIVKTIDPEAWRIIDGKLYLNADQASATELEEVEGQLEKSVTNWPKLRATLVENSD
jgi:hypothetical protein